MSRPSLWVRGRVGFTFPAQALLAASAQPTGEGSTNQVALVLQRVAPGRLCRHSAGILWPSEPRSSWGSRGPGGLRGGERGSAPCWNSVTPTSGQGARSPGPGVPESWPCAQHAPQLSRVLLSLSTTSQPPAALWDRAPVPPLERPFPPDSHALPRLPQGPSEGGGVLGEERPG